MTHPITATFQFENPFDLPDFGESIRTDSGEPDSYVDRMLADPMTRLVMAADGVSDAEVRGFYRRRIIQTSRPVMPGFAFDDQPGPFPGSPRPGIGE